MCAWLNSGTFWHTEPHKVSVSTRRSHIHSLPLPTQQTNPTQRQQTRQTQHPATWRYDYDETCRRADWGHTNWRSTATSWTGKHSCFTDACVALFTLHKRNSKTHQTHVKHANSNYRNTLQQLYIIISSVLGFTLRMIVVGRQLAVDSALPMTRWHFGHKTRVIRSVFALNGPYSHHHPSTYEEWVRSIAHFVYHKDAAASAHQSCSVFPVVFF